MLQTVKTILCNVLEQQLMFNSVMQYPDNSTLNQKYGITADTTSDDSMTINYFGVGLNPQIPNDRFHTVSDRDVYLPAPLYHVKSSDGLSPAEEDTYRIKVEKEVNGVNYIFCFLKGVTIKEYDNDVYELEYDSVLKSYKLKTYIPGVIYTSPSITKDCADVTENQVYYGVSSKYGVRLSIGDITKIRAASTLWYPTFSAARINSLYEIGFYAGNESTRNGQPELNNCIACLLSPLEQHNFKSDGKLSLIVNYGSFNPHV